MRRLPRRSAGPGIAALRSLACLALAVASVAPGCGDPERAAAPTTGPNTAQNTAPNGAPNAGPGAAANAGKAAPAKPARGGFEEVGVASGIAFRMQYLPGEQGENFKTNLYDHGAGVAVGDVDGDGDDDIYLCNQLGPNALYVNDGRGKFTDVTARAGVALADRISVAAVFGDADDDGDQDLFVTTTRGGNALFRNDGTGVFEDVTAAAGLTLVAHSEIPVFFDCDGDGDQDLFVSGTARWTHDVKAPGGHYYEGLASLTELVKSDPEPNHLYRNDGGRFTDVTDAAGVAGTGWGGDVAVFDCDDDGDLDLFVANMFGASRLYRNDGRGKFTDCAKDVLGKTSWGAVGAKVFDHDADGRLDLLVIDMHSDMWLPASAPLDQIEERRKYAGPEGGSVELGYRTPAEVREYREQVGVRLDDVVFGNTLFRNLGGGRYEEVSARANVETYFPWGAAAGDFDLDGTEDLFIASGMGHPFAYWHASLLMSRGDGTYVDRSRETGIDPPPGGGFLDVQIGNHRAARSSRAAAVADFDGDGRPDLIVNNFNDRAHLFRNAWPARHWIGFRLVAPAPGRDAVGATVTLKAGGRTFVRQVPTGGGYLAQSSRTLHVGLADIARIDSCEVRWPGGARQAVDAPKLDAVNVVTKR